MRRRQIFAERAKEAAKAVKDFIIGPVAVSADHDMASEIIEQFNAAHDGAIKVEAIYSCECGKSFPTAHGLNIHKGRAHK